MNISDRLIDALARTSALEPLRDAARGGAVSIAGVSRAAQPFLVAAWHVLAPAQPLLVLTEGLRSQESFHQDLQTWLAPPAARSHSPSEVLLFYPAWDTLPHESRLPHADVIGDRLATLVALSRARALPASAPIVVCTAVAALQRTFAPGEIETRTRTLRQGDHLDPLDLVEWLEDQGYEPEAQVTHIGEIALRGGILDIFPLTSPWPVRLEFFGDELESLRFFDPITQMSREPASEITLPPAGEIGILSKTLESGSSAASPPTLLQHLPAGALVISCTPDLLDEQVNTYMSQLPARDPFHSSVEDFHEQIRQQQFAHIRLWPDAPSQVDPAAPETILALDLPDLEAFRPLDAKAPEPQIADAQRREFFIQLHRWLRQNFAVHVFCNNQGERQRFAEIWDEYGLAEPSAAPPLHPTLHLGTLTRGFQCDPALLVVVTDAEIFGRYKIQRPRRLKSPRAATTRSALDIDFTQLDPGDYVVHLQHGIGRYLGLEHLPAGAAGKTTPPPESAEAAGPECLVIEYAASQSDQTRPKLYVPVTEAHLVSKYVGTGKARPALNTLGGTRWAKAIAQAEEAVRDLASELLAIQAARESQPGHAFKTDTPWQREFESAFLFEETPDQIRAIEQTKKDMESASPMDRLICGDVGFGKTEVAIRAAFKAVLDGKQVAMLVPTTVLAQQHFNTFRERMADYPVRVELLSRFRTKGEQKRVLADLATGAVDIVIGTHRLLQADITFKDLGLVVVDEEQRFGVLHKERLKQLRRLVDVLTLSATPIPRTLYLALTGARDMSTIETPPQDRLPVETIVTQYDERLIRDAIQRELNRGGQVFFLHNRVGTIDVIAQKLKTLVPHARIVVGHGQMHADDLEGVMTQFVNAEADILLSTTIIESGINIPNANTIIIDRADRFGLSDLYQLRGRVGRYKHQAYAYFLLPRHAALLQDVRKRISAIKQYSSLGSGFKIALRDLEIRGAGNLLGPEQSGHITAVGFDLYCQLLKQSVSALKGEKVRPRVDVQLRLDFVALHPTPGIAPALSPLDELAPAVRPAAAHLPLKYIAEPQQRIEIYRKLAQATDKAALDSLRAELTDRFGKIPPPTDLLLQISALKILAAERNVSSIETKDGKIMVFRNDDYIMIGGKFPRLTKKDPKSRLNEIKKLLLALTDASASPSP